MLKNNIYILYPAGYAGSYIRWCLKKSEIDTKHITVDSPINTSFSKEYGGVGTTHLETRIPTHAGIEKTMQWMILNKPVDKLIYLINTWASPVKAKAVHSILNFDRDPIIIDIVNTKQYSRELGNLNAVTKWPSVFDINHQSKIYNINFYDVEDSIRVRNIFVKDFNYIFFNNLPINFNQQHNMKLDHKPFMNQFNTYADFHYFDENWYNIRNHNNPHEVNENQFVKPYKIPKNYYIFDLQDIYADDFVEKLENLVLNLSMGDYDFEYVKKFHSTYVSWQKNLQFINDIDNFKKNKIVTPYLLSHCYLKSIIIRELLSMYPDLLGTNWEEKSTEDLIKICFD